MHLMVLIIIKYALIYEKFFGQEMHARKTFWILRSAKTWFARLPLPGAELASSCSLYASWRTESARGSLLQEHGILGLLLGVSYQGLTTFASCGGNFAINWILDVSQFGSVESLSGGLVKPASNDHPKFPTTRGCNKISPRIEPLLDPCTHRPESMQIMRHLHRGQRHRGVDLRRGQPLVPHPAI